MLENRPHKIRTQRVEVSFENPGDVFECKNHLAEVCKSKLLPAIEKLFDEKAGQKKIIRIDKLYVDAGILDKENWETILVETVISQIRKYLNEEGIEKKFHKKGKSYNDETYNDTSGFTKGEGFSIHEAGKEAEELLYFLQYGVLPWYSTIKSKSAFQEEFILLMEDHKFRQQVSALIKSDVTAFERLVYHAKEESVLSLIEKNEKGQGSLQVLNKSLNRIFVLLDIPSSEQKNIFFKAIYHVWEKTAEKELGIEEITLEVAKLLTRKEYDQLITLGNHSFTQKEKQIIQYIRKYKKDINITDSANKETTDKKSGQKNIKTILDEENPVFITNAGLVLLHPFLSGLFENVGYTDKNQWISEDLHQRALLLTQFLITGNDEYPEFDLLLNKILTGYPLDDSLPVEIVLSDFEKGEAADLLQAVINHWKALKNTSIAGLQNTFLQREGKILKKESGWLLQVEQKAFDILLDKIPWGFSTIKTFWMDEILSVEWA